MAVGGGVAAAEQGVFARYDEGILMIDSRHLMPSHDEIVPKILRGMIESEDVGRSGQRS